MSTRERILAIRLLEKLENHPAFAAALGLEYAETSEEEGPGPKSVQRT